MPLVRFDYPGRKLSVQRNMPTPKKIQDLWKGWYKEARKAIPVVPTIPQLGGNLPDNLGLLWRTSADPQVSVDFIRYDLENNLGERAYLVIARSNRL